MQSDRLRTIIVFLLGMVLLAPLLPARAQAPGPPQTQPEILEFDRKLCPVCRESELIIREVKNEYPGQFLVRKIYIDEEPNLFHHYKVFFVPTQIFLDATGKEVSRHEGVFAKNKLIQRLRDLKFIQGGKE